MRRGHARIRIVEARTELTAEAFAAAQDLFAELIALTFAREHPHLFGLDVPPKQDSDSAGSPLTARAEAAAPAARSDAPASMELEQYDECVESR